MPVIFRTAYLLAFSGLSLIISGCGLSSEDIVQMNTQSLCKTVTSPNNINFKNTEILSELRERSADQCATPEILQSNLEAFRIAQEAERNQSGGDGGGGGY